jgi:hypothetical protein
MDAATMDSILTEALSRNFSVVDGAPTLMPDGIWLIPIHHFRVGCLKANFQDREIRSATDRDRAVQELTHRIGWAISSAE